jgi:hypothetical protein
MRNVGDDKDQPPVEKKEFIDHTCVQANGTLYPSFILGLVETGYIPSQLYPSDHFATVVDLRCIHTDTDDDLGVDNEEGEDVAGADTEEDEADKEEEMDNPSKRRRIEESGSENDSMEEEDSDSEDYAFRSECGYHLYHLHDDIARGDHFTVADLGLGEIEPRHAKGYMSYLLEWGSPLYGEWDSAVRKTFLRTLHFLSCLDGEKTLLSLKHIEFLCQLVRDSSLCLPDPVIFIPLILRLLLASLQTGDNSAEEFELVLELVERLICGLCPGSNYAFDLAKLYSVSLGDPGDIEKLANRLGLNQPFRTGFILMLRRFIRPKIPLGLDWPNIDGVSEYPEGTLCTRVLYEVLFTGGARVKAAETAEATRVSKAEWAEGIAEAARIFPFSVDIVNSSIRAKDEEAVCTAEAAKAEEAAKPARKEARLMCSFFNDYLGDISDKDGSVKRFVLPDGKILGVDTICSLLIERYSLSPAVLTKIEDGVKQGKEGSGDDGGKEDESSPPPSRSPSPVYGTLDSDDSGDIDQDNEVHCVTEERLTETGTITRKRSRTVADSLRGSVPTEPRDCFAEASLIPGNTPDGFDEPKSKRTKRVSEGD